MQGLLTAVALPPLSLALLAVTGGLLAWRGWRAGGALAALAAALQILLATPLCADLLVSSLERGVQPGQLRPTGAAPPAAIVILGAEAMRNGPVLEVGPLTLERLRVGAALQRRTELPVLVTAGPLAEGQPPLGPIMARSLAEDFGVAARWTEPAARDTRENALCSAELLHEAGIRSVWLVTHGWHMPRAQEAFARAGLATAAAPVRIYETAVLATLRERLRGAGV
jgi:uncharacterized SAM-binding protein YcdF (DUF218 family)